MLQKLINLATGTLLVNDRTATTFLRKTIICRKCGMTANLTRFVNLHPRGIRGYYVCPSLHNLALDRDGVTRMTNQTGDRVYFA